MGVHATVPLKNTPEMPVRGGSLDSRGQVPVSEHPARCLTLLAHNAKAQTTPLHTPFQRHSITGERVQREQRQCEEHGSKADKGTVQRH